MTFQVQISAALRNSLENIVSLQPHQVQKGRFLRILGSIAEVQGIKSSIFVGIFKK